MNIPPRLQPFLRCLGRAAQAQGLSAYAVGGCVRDWLLGDVKMADLDVTVEGDGIALARAVARALGGTLRIHQQFGTATIVMAKASGARRVDVASCRKETYARPAAYPRVQRGTLRDDLFRRDFTINAMAVALAPDQLGVLVDPFDGAGDLRRRVLRVLHARSFLDDPSRILRGIRFAERFALRWEPATRQALQGALAAGALSWLNAGRIRKELDAMLEEPDPLACLAALASHLDPSTTEAVS